MLIVKAFEFKPSFVSDYDCVGKQTIELKNNNRLFLGAVFVPRDKVSQYLKELEAALKELPKNENL